MSKWFTSARQWAQSAKRDVVALWIAARDTRTPVIAKVVAGVVAAYALSPIDLIPDFIPVLGYLDDLLIVPLGIILAIRLIPAPLMHEYRQRALAEGKKPVSRAGFAAIVAIWSVFAAGSVWIAHRHFVVPSFGSE